MNENDPQQPGQQPAQSAPDQPAQPQAVEQPQPAQPQAAEQPYQQQQPPQQYYQQPAQPQYQQQPPVKGVRGRSLGIAAMVLGIIAAVMSFIPAVNIISFPLVVVGLILGIISLVLARGGQGPKSFGIAGIVCSAVALIITVVMYVTLAAAAVVGTTAVEYFDENASVGVGVNENVKVNSIAWVDDNTLTVELENTSSDTISSVGLALPIYNAQGHLADTALGSAYNVEPGTFTVEIKTVLTSDSDVYTFKESALVITTL